MLGSTRDFNIWILALLILRIIKTTHFIQGFRFGPQLGEWSNISNLMGIQLLHLMFRLEKALAYARLLSVFYSRSKTITFRIAHFLLLIILELLLAQSNSMILPISVIRCGKKNGTNLIHCRLTSRALNNYSIKNWVI